jgi:hypothetical protein
VPPWEDLHELSRAELRLTNLVTTDAIADVLPRDLAVPMAEAKPKSVQDRFVSAPADEDAQVHPAKATKTAEVQTGGTAPPAEKPAQPQPAQPEE